MRLMITGANGQLGLCLQDRGKNYNFGIMAFKREELDISDRVSVEQVFIEYQPDIVINAAAFTAVDKAETDSKISYAVNEIGPKNIARECNKQGIPLIHISTDYVFDGKATEEYQVDSQTNPQNIYGKSKLAGEFAIQKECDKYIIIRTSWVFSEYGNNFVKTMLRLGKERQTLNVVSDQYGVPCYAGDLASCIYRCIELIDKGVKKWGVYHFSGGSIINWHEFAKRIFTVAVAEKIFEKSPEVKPIPTSKFPTPAKRPFYSVLSGTKLEKDWECVPTNWNESLQLVVSKLAISE